MTDRTAVMKFGAKKQRITGHVTMRILPPARITYPLLLLEAYHPLQQIT